MSRGFIPPKPATPSGPPPRYTPPPRPRKVWALSAAGALAAIVIFSVVWRRVIGAPPDPDPAPHTIWQSTRPTPPFPARVQPPASPPAPPSPPIVVTPDLTAEAQSVCDKFAASLKRADRADLAMWIDGPRALAEVRRFTTVRDRSGRSDARIARDFAAALADGLASNPILRFNRTQVRKIQPLPGPGEAIVYVRAWNDTSQMKYRWWFKKTGTVWRLYDIEELDSGIRAFHALAADIASVNGEPPPLWINALRPLMLLDRALDRKDLAAAEAALRELEPARFPPQLEGLRLALKGLIRGARGNDKEALQLYDQAEAINPDLPVVHLFRAVTYNVARQPAAALESARRYIDLVGDTAKGCHELGLAHEALHHPAEAAAAYQRGLDDDPTSADNQAGLARVRAAGAKPPF